MTDPGFSDAELRQLFDAPLLAEQEDAEYLAQSEAALGRILAVLPASSIAVPDGLDLGSGDVPWIYRTLASTTEAEAGFAYFLHAAHAAVLADQQGLMDDYGREATLQEIALSDRGGVGEQLQWVELVEGLLGFQLLHADDQASRSIELAKYRQDAEAIRADDDRYSHATRGARAIMQATLLGTHGEHDDLAIRASPD